jgi:hypothetical protein
MNLKTICLPDIPQSYMIAVLLVSMIVMSILGIDGWVHSTLGIIVGWLVGVKSEQSRKEVIVAKSEPVSA